MKDQGPYICGASCFGIVFWNGLSCVYKAISIIILGSVVL
jgi:hypothetical protein